MFKRVISMMLVIFFVVAFTLGCETSSQSTNSNGEYIPTELKILFRPSQNAEMMEAKSKPLETLLSQHLGIPVKVNVSTDFNTMIEALAAKQVDVAFLAPTAYVLAADRGAADVILTSQRFDIKTPTGQPTDELVDFYRAIIVVKEDSDIHTLEDLKGKRMGWQNVTSSAGYVWPAVEMKRAGIDPENDVQGITLIGFDQGVLAVLNDDVDAAAFYEDARNLVVKDYPDVFEKTRILHVTEPVPNDAIAVRPDLSEEWKKKLQNAFLEMMKDPEAYQIMNDLYIHEGYTIVEDHHFDRVREYNKEVGQ